MAQVSIDSLDKDQIKSVSTLHRNIGQRNIQYNLELLHTVLRFSLIIQ